MRIGFDRKAAAACRVGLLRSYVPPALWVVLAAVFSLSPVARAEEPVVAGARIYRQQCASCHGDKGQGSQEQELGPLVGDLSVRELAAYITEAMPEDDPEACQGSAAKAVASYIWEAFYSPTAQVRNQPPKIELSRLTVRQYRNSIADLVSSFTGSPSWEEGAGLGGEYYKSKRRRKEDRVIERVDPVVDFQFQDASPDPEQIEPEEFTIRWEGSILAPETGMYEFILESENGVQLWINDPETPLIDARVRSGDQTEYRESLSLLGGRAYPLRLEFQKAKADKTSSVRLKWKPPSFTEQVISSRHLSPSRTLPSLVVETPFPPDDRSVGYERGVSVSKQWHEATTFAAIEVANKILQRLDQIAKPPREPGPRAERLQEFCVQWAERAFRQPLDEQQRTLYVDRHFERANNPDVATKRVLLLVLTSPRFLFPDAAATTFDDYQVATWLALTLWDSVPDQALLDAASAGKLRSRDEISQQADRMVHDPRTKAKVREFFRQWLKFDHFQEMSKTEMLYPDFNDEIASDLRSSLELFVEQVVWSERSDFRDLLQTETVFLNERLAEYYRVELPEGRKGQFHAVSLDPGHRAGLLTHPYLMAGFAYDDTSSPIHRGVFLARSLLGRFLKPPPEAVTPIPPDLHPDLTTRQRVEMQTKGVSCRTCHGMINQLGFSLEEFDAVGRFRQLEQDRPIDPSGSYINREGNPVDFEGAPELANFLVESPECHEAFTEQLFQYLIKQPIQAFGSGTLERLRGSFANDDFHVRHLIRDIAVESVLTARDLNGDPSNQ